jgi:hypothetical protein
MGAGSVIVMEPNNFVTDRSFVRDYISTHQLPHGFMGVIQIYNPSLARILAVRCFKASSRSISLR